MNDLTLNSQPTFDGINKYGLLQSESEYVREIYAAVFEKVKGSYTTISDNDASGRFDVAIATFQPTDLQLDQLLSFKDAFKTVETKIDPNRLKFSIAKALDNEICINKESASGLSKIIIHDDGLIAFSFISFSGVEKPDVLEFYDCDLDYEQLAYQLFF